RRIAAHFGIQFNSATYPVFRLRDGNFQGGLCLLDRFIARVEHQGRIVLDVVIERLEKKQLKPMVQTKSVWGADRVAKKRRFIEDIHGLGDSLRSQIKFYTYGILVFINGHEPGEGTIPLDEILLHGKEEIHVWYMLDRTAR